MVELSKVALFCVRPSKYDVFAALVGGRLKVPRVHQITNINNLTEDHDKYFELTLGEI